MGSGWLSQPLYQQLASTGHQATLSTTTEDKRNQLQQAGFDAITHRIGDPVDTHMTNADVVVMANTCKDVTAYEKMISNWPVEANQQIIYTSTTGVYLDNGDTHDESSQALNTDHPTHQIEQVLQPRQATVVRLAGLVGPGRHPGRFFRKTGTIRNPQNPVNLIHLDDAIGLIGQLIEHPHPGKIFNGCADNHPSKGDYYSHMAELNDGSILNTSAPTDTAGKIISNQASQSQLGYQYQHPDVWHMPFD